jgi:hypothetical protein
MLKDSPEPARFTFQRAIEIADQVGAYNKAGLAALTLIEELADSLSLAVIVAAYNGADRWLAELPAQHEMRLRLNAAAHKVLSRYDLSLKPEKSVVPCDLRDEVLKLEERLISHALAAANGRITRAAALLGTTHQSLSAMIQVRHPELMAMRVPVRLRSRLTKRQPQTKLPRTEKN